MHKQYYSFLTCILLIANVCERQRKLPPAAVQFTVAGRSTPQSVCLSEGGKAEITLTIASHGGVVPGAKYHLKTWSLPFGLHGALTDVSGNALSSVTLGAGEHRLFYQPFNAGEHVLTLVWTDAHHAHWQTLHLGPITALQGAGQPAADGTSPAASEGPTEVKAAASTASAPAEEKKAPAKAVEGPGEQKEGLASEGAAAEQVAKKGSTSGGSIPAATTDSPTAPTRVSTVNQGDAESSADTELGALLEEGSDAATAATCLAGMLGEGSDAATARGYEEAEVFEEMQKHGHGEVEECEKEERAAKSVAPLALEALQVLEAQVRAYLSAPLPEHTFAALEALLRDTEAAIVDMHRLPDEQVDEDLKALRTTLEAAKGQLNKEYLQWQEVMALRGGKDLNEADAKGRYALHALAGGGTTFSAHQSALFDFVVQHTVAVDGLCGGRIGQTPLQHAVRAGNKAAVERLLAHGADIAAGDGQGNPVLATALAAQQQEMVTLLLSHQADPYAVNSQGISVLSQAIQRRDAAGVALLLSQGAKISGALLLEALSHGLFELASSWIKKRGIDVNYKGKRGETALMLAASAGASGIVKQLLDKRADVSVQATGGGFSRYYCDVKGWTALHAAIESGDIATLEALRQQMSWNKDKIKGLKVTLSLGKGIYPHEDAHQYVKRMYLKFSEEDYQAILKRIKSLYGYR